MYPLPYIDVLVFYIDDVADYIDVPETIIDGRQVWTAGGLRRRFVAV